MVITSNRTREVHDALKRRCLYHWVGYPDAEREMAIIRARRPQAAEALAREVVQFVQELRQRDLFKAPGVAETLDWISALHELDCVSLDPAGDQRHPRRAAQVPGRHREDGGLGGQAHPRSDQVRDTSQGTRRTT